MRVFSSAMGRTLEQLPRIQEGDDAILERNRTVRRVAQPKAGEPPPLVPPVHGSADAVFDIVRMGADVYGYDLALQHVEARLDDFRFGALDIHVDQVDRLHSG